MRASDQPHACPSSSKQTSSRTDVTSLRHLTSIRTNPNGRFNFASFPTYRSITVVDRFASHLAVRTGRRSMRSTRFSPRSLRRVSHQTWRYHLIGSGLRRQTIRSIVVRWSLHLVVLLALTQCDHYSTASLHRSNASASAILYNFVHHNEANHLNTNIGTSAAADTTRATPNHNHSQHHLSNQSTTSRNNSEERSNNLNDDPGRNTFDVVDTLSTDRLTSAFNLPEVAVRCLRSSNDRSVAPICFALVGRTSNWQQADHFCATKLNHSRLASIRSLQLQQLIENWLIGDSTNSSLIRELTINLANGTGLWIGANDRKHENAFIWPDGTLVQYANWFPGWDEIGRYGRQPSDDGFSNQDCVELRSHFRRPTKGFETLQATSLQLFWNDLSCDQSNAFFLCELKSINFDSNVLALPSIGCDETVMLNNSYTWHVLTSPGFPSIYSSNLNCVYNLGTAESDKQLELQFTHFHLEDNHNCSFDRLSIELNDQSRQTICGDWNGRVKLLRFERDRIRLHFQTDSDYAYSGFRAELRLLPAAHLQPNRTSRCDPLQFQQWNSSCYLFGGLPPVSLDTAHHICADQSSSLLDVAQLPKNGSILLRMLHSIVMHTTPGQPLIWIQSNQSTELSSPSSPSPSSSSSSPSPFHMSSSCLALSQNWAPHNSPPSISFQIISIECDHKLPFVCWKPAFFVHTAHPNPRVLIHSTGRVQSPHYPSHYPPLTHQHTLLCPLNMCQTFLSSTNTQSPLSTLINETHSNRISLDTNHEQPTNNQSFMYAFHVKQMQIEYQSDCLYDALEIVQITSNANLSDTRIDGWKLCGRSNARQLQPEFIFTASDRSVLFRFHSDHSIQYAGYHIEFERISLDWCSRSYRHIWLNETPIVFHTPSFERMQLPNLDCELDIQTTPNYLIQFTMAETNLSAEHTKTTSNSQSPDCASKQPHEKHHVWLELHLGLNHSVQFCDPADRQSSQIQYFSYESRMRLHYRSLRWTWGQNFTRSAGVSFTLRAVRRDLQAISVVRLHARSIEPWQIAKSNVTIETSTIRTGKVNSINFPLSSQPDLRARLYLRAPIEHQIELRAPARMRFKLLNSISSSPSSSSSSTSSSSSSLAFSSSASSFPVRIVDPFAVTHVRPSVPHIWTLVSSNQSDQHSITSTFHVLAIESEPNASLFSFLYNLRSDTLLKNRTENLPLDYPLDSCAYDPCENAGQCRSIDQEDTANFTFDRKPSPLKSIESDWSPKAVCACGDTRRGLFCHLNLCDLRPCTGNGLCRLNSHQTDYTCHCKPGFAGRYCTDTVGTCDRINPCGDRGKCSLLNGLPNCVCHAWYEGKYCERFRIRIQYKPLSQRMLQEPFWLGLLAVSVVLFIICFVYCLKKKFAERIERFFTEEIQRSKSAPGFNAIESGSSAPRYSLTSNLGVSLGIGGGHASLGNTPPMARSRSSIISRLYSRHPFSRNVQIGGLVGGVGGSGHLSDTEMPARKATDGYFSDTEYTNRRRFPALLFLSQKLAAQSAAAHASSGEIDNLDHSQPTQSLANSATGSNRNLFQSLFGGGTSSAGAGTTVAGPANLTLASSGNEISAGAESICGNESGRSNIRRLSLYELVRFGDYKLRRKQTTNRRKTDKESDRNQAMVDNRDAIDAAMARPMNTNGISGHHPLLSSTYGVDSNSASLTLPQDPLRCPLADSLRMQLLRNELIASGGVANAAHGNFQVIAETSQEDQESVPSVDNLDGNSISVNQTRSGQQQRQQLFVAHSRGSRSSLTSQRRRSRSRSHSSREELPPDRLGETVSGHEKPQSIVTYLDAGNFLNANTNELPLRRLSAPSAADRPNGSALAVNRNNLLPLSARTLRTSESADSARVHRTGSNTQINGTRKLSLELCVPQIMINDQEQQSAEIQTNSTTHYPWIDEGGRSVINATADLSQQKSQTAQKSTGTTPWLPNQQSADVERTNLARSECNLSTSAFNWANSPSNLDPSEMTKATRPITGSVGPTPKSVSITRTRSGEKRHEAKERRERLLALRRLNSIQPYPIAFDRSGSMLEPPAVTQNTRHLQSVAKSLDELEFRQMNTSTLPGSIESGQLLSATNVAIDQTAVRSLSPDQRRTLSCGGGPGANTSAVTGRKNWPVAVGDGSLQWQRRRSSSESDCDTGHLFRSIRMQSFQHDAPPPRSQLMDAFGPYFNFQSNMSNNDTNASDVNTSNAANNRRSVPPSNMRRSARFRCRSNLEGAELVTPFSSGAMFTHDQWSDTENSTHRSAQQLDHFHCPPPQYYLHDNLIDPTQSMQSYQERHQESTLQHHHSLHHRLLSTHQLHHPSLPAHHDHSGDRSIDALRSPSTAPTFEPHPDLYSEVLEAYPGHTASRRHRDALVRSLSFSRSDSALAIRCALAAGCGSAPLDDAQLSSPNSQCESNRLSRRRYRQVSAVASRQISEQQVRETASRLSSWPATIQPGVSSNLIGDQWAKSVDQISKSSSSFDSSESSSSIDRQ